METEVLQGTDTPQVEVKPSIENPPENTPEQVQKFVDPGQLEGRRNEPIKHEPPVNSKRWNQIYWENKEKDRKIAELEKSLAEKNTALPEKEVSEQIHVQPEIKSPPHQVNQNFNSLNTIEGIEKAIAVMRDKKARAYEEMNWGEVSRCDDAISDIKEKRTHMMSFFISEQKTVDDFINSIEWLSPNSPKYDPVMAGAAKYLDDEMIKTFNGNLQDRLNKVKDTIEKRFGYGVKTIEPKTPQNQGKAGLGFIPPTVEGVMSNLSSSKNVVLTDTQKIIAKKMFPNNPNAEMLYAKNL